MIKLADRAAEEDTKEDLLLYSVLAKTQARRSDIPSIDHAIENFIFSNFGISVDFDVSDALSRLLADGLVTETSDGELRALPPTQAAQHLDQKWDVFLDHLSDFGQNDEGQEFAGHSGSGLA
jgi:hypothetical protein